MIILHIPYKGNRIDAKKPPLVPAWAKKLEVGIFWQTAVGISEYCSSCKHAREHCKLLAKYPGLDIDKAVIQKS